LGESLIDQLLFGVWVVPFGQPREVIGTNIALQAEVVGVRDRQHPERSEHG